MKICIFRLFSIVFNHQFYILMILLSIQIYTFHCLITFTYFFFPFCNYLSCISVDSPIYKLPLIRIFLSITILPLLAFSRKGRWGSKMESKWSNFIKLLFLHILFTSEDLTLVDTAGIIVLVHMLTNHMASKLLRSMVFHQNWDLLYDQWITIYFTLLWCPKLISPFQSRGVPYIKETELISLSNKSLLMSSGFTELTDSRELRVLSIS